MRVGDVMTRNPVVVTREALLRDAAALMREFDVGMIPVVDAMETRRLVGVITDRDIATRCVAASHAGYCRVEEHMTPEPDSVGPDADLGELVSRMSREQVRRMPVTDDAHAVIGIVTMADLAPVLDALAPRMLVSLVEAVSLSTKPRKPTEPVARFVNPDEVEPLAVY